MTPEEAKYWLAYALDKRDKGSLNDDHAKRLIATIGACRAATAANPKEPLDQQLKYSIANQVKSMGRWDGTPAELLKAGAAVVDASGALDAEFDTLAADVKSTDVAPNKASIIAQKGG